MQFVPEDCSQKAVNGNTVSVHYTVSNLMDIHLQGYLYKNGVKFDSSIDRHTPFSFKLGAGRVIKGWEQGVLGMCPSYYIKADYHLVRREDSLFLQTLAMV